MKRYNVHDIKALAQNRWKEIFLALAPTLKEAVENAGKHVRCPVHGGEDGFRLFPNYNAKGDGICNSCGAQTDGIAMLQWVNGWSFSDTVNAVGQLLDGPESAGQIEPIDQQIFEGEFVSLEEVERIWNNRTVQRVNLKLKTNGKTQEFFGADLKRVCGGFQSGDYIRLSKIGKKSVEINGKVVQKFIWTACKTLTPQELEAQEREKQAKELESAQQRMESIKKVWKESLIISQDDKRTWPVMRYLQHRGLQVLFDPRQIRCHPNLGFYEDGRCVGHYPAMICAVRNEQGEIVTLHRTYLTEQGYKAELPEPKKIMAVPNHLTMSGGAIRLFPPFNDTLCVAEGVETAMSVTQITGLACWSMISEGGMRHFEVPNGIRFVNIFADKDKSGIGEEAAKALQQRLLEKGIGSWIYLPVEAIAEDEKSVDWNDVLRNNGLFPRL